MPFSAGVFTRTDGTFTGATVFQQERDAAIDILAVNLDYESQDIANGLSTCILKDGTQTITANIPWASFQITQLGAGTARTSAANVGQIQDGAVFWLGTVGGTANALTGTLSPSITAYTAGMTVWGVIAATNTGAATLALNGLASPVAIRKKMASGLVALVGGEMVIGTLQAWTHNGTYFVLADKAEWQQGADITSAATVDLGAATGEYVRVSGSTGPITSFGTIAAGVTRFVTFLSTPTLTHNATSLILPGGANITAAAGDNLIAVSLGSGNWRVTNYAKASGEAVIVQPGGMTWSHITGNTNAVTNNGYSCDTSGGAITLTLPGSPSVGDIVGFTDGAGTFNTNALTIGRNGLKIMGLSEDMTVNTQYAGAQLVYDGATNGWRLA
jgi:hypothetical protein